MNGLNKRGKYSINTDPVTTHDHFLFNTFIVKIPGVQRLRILNTQFKRMTYLYSVFKFNFFTAF